MDKRHTLLSIFLGGFFATFVLTAAAIELPDIGDSSGSAISPEKERQIGAALFRNLQGHSAILDDPETQDYLTAIGQRLVLSSDNAGQEFTFFTIASIEINAFAAPGGYIGVNAGLILNTETESELAGVLAHEISHVTQRHLARSFEHAGQLSLPVAVATIGALILGVANPDAGLAALTAVSAGSAQNQINFTRANEQEADRVGMALLYRAEFNPAGMPDFFKRLQTANRLTDPKFLPEFLRSHPVTESRIADSKNRLAQYPPHYHKDNKAYFLTKARIAVAAAETPQQAVKLFKAKINESSEYDIDTHYGYAIALTQARKYDEARSEIDRVINSDPENLSFLLVKAELESEAGNPKKSLQLFKHLDSLYPNNRPIIINYAKTLLRSNHIKEAKKLLLDYGILHGTDRSYYSLLAEAEARSGATLESHLALAEFHYLSGDTKLALDQLKFAQRSSRNLDHYNKRRLEARIEQIEKELKAERELREK